MITNSPAFLRKLTLLCSFLFLSIAANAQMNYNLVDSVIDSKESFHIKPVRTMNTAPIIFRDNGKGVLKNGVAEIQIDPTIASMIDGKKIEEMIQLSIQMNGKSNGVYISKKNKHTFVITELLNGASNAPFSYNLSLQAAD